MSTGRIWAGLVPATHSKLVSWLLCVCLMIFIMAIVGAITRLTESGLSIMEWALFKGTFPPLSQEEWQRLFALYQDTDEYRIDNAGMDLSAFKTIFWWEWIHRFWGRVLGLVYFVGLVWFWLKGQIPRWAKAHLVFALILGGLQGSVGWFMVASGFDDGLTDVSHFRLAAHLSFALILYSYLLVLALKLGWPVGKGRSISAPRRLYWGLMLGLIGFIITILSGAFVAGLNAGLIYAEWPLMGGQLVPSDYVHPQMGFWTSILNHDTAVQFNHRWLATVLGLFTCGLALYGFSISSRPGHKVLLGLLAVTPLFQIGLGIATLLYLVPTSLGALHQGGAIVLLTLYWLNLHASKR